jgi:hypothetical protein
LFIKFKELHNTGSCFFICTRVGRVFKIFKQLSISIWKKKKIQNQRTAAGSGSSGKTNQKNRWSRLFKRALQNRCNFRERTADHGYFQGIIKEPTPAMKNGQFSKVRNLDTKKKHDNPRVCSGS